MSSFIKLTPDGKRWAAIDNHFGHHQYGYAIMKPDDTWETLDLNKVKVLTEKEFYDIYYPKQKYGTLRRKTNGIFKKIAQHSKSTSKDRTNLVLLITKFLLDNEDLRVWQGLQALEVIVSSVPYSGAFMKDEFYITDDALYQRVKGAYTRLEKQNKK